MVMGRDEGGMAGDGGGADHWQQTDENESWFVFSVQRFVRDACNAGRFARAAIRE